MFNVKKKTKKNLYFYPPYCPTMGLTILFSSLQSVSRVFIFMSGFKQKTKKLREAA